MPLDPNIILQASQGQKPLNALEMYGQFANIQNAQNQNRLFQAQRAAGGMAQQATGPDGQFDRNKFNALMAQNPDAAPYAFDALEHGNAIGTGQEGLTQAHIASANAELGIMGPAVTSLLADKGPLTFDKVSKAAASVVGHPDYPGDWKSQFIQNTVGYLANLKQAADQAGPDPRAQDTAIRGQLTQLATRIENTRAQFSQIAGQPMAVNTGGQTQIIAPSTVTGQTTGLGAITNTMSPEAEGAPRPTVQYDAQGRPVPGSVPASAVVTPTGQPRAGSGFLASGAAPGISEAAQATGLGSGQMLNEYRAEAANAPRELQAISAAADALGKVGTGRGTAQRNAIMGYIQALPDGVLKALPGMTDDRLAQIRSGNADYDTAVKYMTQIAGNAAAQYGAGTNEKLLVAAHGNASVDINHVAAEDMLKVQAALVRSKQVALRTWEQQGRPDADFSKWVSSEWAPNVDVRAFMVDKMTPQQRKTMIDGMNPAERKVFFRSVQAAHEANLPGISDLLAGAR